MRIFKCILPALLLLQLVVNSQTITYTDPHDIQSSVKGLDIIGKISGNFLICKLMKGTYKLEIFNAELKLKRILDLNFIPAETYRINFITYPTCTCLLYQCKINEVSFCRIAKLDAEGRLLQDLTVDSINSKVYKGQGLFDYTVSGNKKYVLFSRLFSGIQPGKLQVDQVVVDETLSVVSKEKYFIPYSKNSSVTELKIDNERNILFATTSQMNSNTKITFYKLPFNSDELSSKEIAIEKYELKNPELRTTENPNLYYLASLYVNAQTKNVEGFLSIVLKSDLSDYTHPLMYSFPDSLRIVAHDTPHPETAFNSYLLKDIIFKKDGSFVLTAVFGENIVSSKSQANETAFRMKSNTLDFYEMPDIYSDDGKRILYFGGGRIYPIYEDQDATKGEGLRSNTSKMRGNVLVFSIDKYNRVTAFKSLSRHAELTPFLPYYQVMNSGEHLSFIFNQGTSLKYLLNCLTLDENNNLHNNYFVKSFDRNYIFYPELARQIDNKSMLIPCTNNKRWVYALVNF